VSLLLNRELVSRAKFRLVSAFPDIVKDCPKMRNLPKIFLRSFENVGPDHPTNSVNRGGSLPSQAIGAINCQMTDLIAWPSHQLVGYSEYLVPYLRLLLILDDDQQNTEVRSSQIQRQKFTTLCQPTPNPTDPCAYARQGVISVSLSVCLYDCPLKNFELPIDKFCHSDSKVFF